MLLTSYQTVFEIGPMSFSWGALLGPLILPAGGVFLYRISKEGTSGRAASILMSMLGVLVFLGSAWSLFPEYYEAHRAYVKGESSIVEGQVENFRPMPKLGRSIESFSVKSIHFSYDPLSDTPCFHNAPPHRGPIREESAVRVYYNQSCIQRLDILR
jgi:hypothetical protein